VIKFSEKIIGMLAGLLNVETNRCSEARPQSLRLISSSFGERLTFTRIQPRLADAQSDNPFGKQALAGLVMVVFDAAQSRLGVTSS
jgi:hypothetical protein